MGVLRLLYWASYLVAIALVLVRRMEES